jgi:hypothetical protein
MAFPKTVLESRELDPAFTIPQPRVVPPIPALRSSATAVPVIP